MLVDESEQACLLAVYLLVAHGGEGEVYLIVLPQADHVGLDPLTTLEHAWRSVAVEKAPVAILNDAAVAELVLLSDQTGDA